MSYFIFVISMVNSIYLIFGFFVNLDIVLVIKVVLGMNFWVCFVVMMIFWIGKIDIFYFLEFDFCVVGDGCSVIVCYVNNLNYRNDSFICKESMVYFMI